MKSDKQNIELANGTKVKISFEAKILNPIFDYDKNIIGYRVVSNDPGFWSIVPAKSVKKL